MSEPPVVIRGLSKIFDMPLRQRVLGIDGEQLRALLPLWRRIIGRKDLTARPFHSLRDINLEVHGGEILGIIGRNGAGKTTLLKILARVLEPSTGEIHLRGRVASLLELGSGFSDELTVSENVRLHLALSGEKGNKALEEEIIALAELGEYRDATLEDCPGNAAAQLSFATLISINSEIVLADEMLAVGSAHFKELSMQRIQKLRTQGGCVLFVSHDLAAVREICDRVVWLDRGQIKMTGTAQEVIDAYEGAVIAKASAFSARSPAGQAAAIADLRVVNSAGLEISAVNVDREAFLECAVQHLRPEAPVIAEVEVHAQKRLALLSTTLGSPIASVKRRSLRLQLRIPPQFLVPGSYLFRLRLSWQGADPTKSFVRREIMVRIIGPAAAADPGAPAPRNAEQGLAAVELPWRMVILPADGERMRDQQTENA